MGHNVFQKDYFLKKRLDKIRTKKLREERKRKEWIKIHSLYFYVSNVKYGHRNYL